jgi:hypothetical protein
LKTAIREQIIKMFFKAESKANFGEYIVALCIYGMTSRKYNTLGFEKD